MSGKYHPEPTLHRHKVPARAYEGVWRANPDAVAMLLHALGYPRVPPILPQASHRFVVLEQ